MNTAELSKFIELLLSQKPLTPEEMAQNICYLRTLEDLALRLNGEWDKTKLQSTDRKVTQ